LRASRLRPLARGFLMNVVTAIHAALAVAALGSALPVLA
jgi:hypothetical protein